MSRAVVQQSNKALREATAPYQYGLATRAGMDAIVHALTALTDTDPDLVVMAIDGIGAFDHVRRASFLGKLHSTATLQNLLPLARMLYGSESTFLWVDDDGVTHKIRQGEGGEQGDQGNFRR